jgi:hypothetical protein
MLSLYVGVDCLRKLESGMRLGLPRPLYGSDVVSAVGEDGRAFAVEPSDRGCEIQSSDNESSQAFSIVKRFKCL